MNDYRNTGNERFNGFFSLDQAPLFRRYERLVTSYSSSSPSWLFHLLAHRYLVSGTVGEENEEPLVVKHKECLRLNDASSMTTCKIMLQIKRKPLSHLSGSGGPKMHNFADYSL